MYIREDQITSPSGVMEQSLVDLLDIPPEKKQQVKEYYTTNILKNCVSYARTVHFEGDHVRIVTKLSYPSIEQFDQDLENYRKFFSETTGTTIAAMIEGNGYKNQLLYEDIV